MPITAGPSTPAWFAAKMVLDTRIDPVWKIASPDVAGKSLETVKVGGKLVRSTEAVFVFINLCIAIVYPYFVFM